MATSSPSEAAARPSSHAALSVEVFGLYLMLTGLALLTHPNILLGLFGIAPAIEVWIRIVGTLALILGYYSWACGRAGVLAFFRASIVGRLRFCAACVGLILLVQAPVQLLLFGASDLAGALWTGWALKHPNGR